MPVVDDVASDERCGAAVGELTAAAARFWTFGPIRDRPSQFGQAARWTSRNPDALGAADLVGRC